LAGPTKGKKADPKTLHAFVNANGAAINKLATSCRPPMAGSSWALTG